MGNQSSLYAETNLTVLGILVCTCVPFCIWYCYRLCIPFISQILTGCDCSLMLYMSIPHLCAAFDGCIVLSALVIFLIDALHSFQNLGSWDCMCHVPLCICWPFWYSFFKKSGYVQSGDPADNWKDKGTGQLSIRCKEGVSKGTKESKPTVIVRNDVCFPSRLLWFQILKLVWKCSLTHLVVLVLFCAFPLLNVGVRSVVC